MAALVLPVVLLGACTGGAAKTASPTRSPGAPSAASPSCNSDRRFVPGSLSASAVAHIKNVIGKKELGLAVGVRGRTIFGQDARQHRIPASNEKLLLTMALFDELSPGFRIPTTVASRDPLQHGVVHGDLWLIGQGDPTLTDHQRHYWGSGLDSTTLRRLARRIKAAGVDRVEGHVIGGSTYFAHDLHAPGWHSFVPHNYVEPLTSLVVNGNNTVRHGAEKRAAKVLTKELRRAGVVVGRTWRSGDPPRVLHRIATVRSASIKEILRFTDINSNNFFAEMLGKLLGAKTFGPPGTIAKGARAIQRWAASHGVEARSFDSSGLSFKDRMSPAGFVKLLGAAERRPWLASLREVLPSAGEGTLVYRLTGLNVRAKTGTLFSGPSALTGWVRSHGHWIEFSILDNGASKAVEDKIVRNIARGRVRMPRRAVERC